jgi:hypothetical protein
MIPHGSSWRVNRHRTVPSGAIGFFVSEEPVMSTYAENAKKDW